MAPAMSDDQDLSALLGSRICHDLISPLGAIANGVELLQMSGAAASPEVALIAESVANANARIRFFRVAYGIASAGQRVGRRVRAIELAPAYVDLAIARFRSLHPDLPVTVEGDGRSYDAVASQRGEAAGEATAA